MTDPGSPHATASAVDAAARAEATAIADWARGLDAAGWEAPSWCEGWSARDVIAHLAEGHDRFGLQLRAGLAGGPVPAFSEEERTARREQLKEQTSTNELVAALEERTAQFFGDIAALADGDLTRPAMPLGNRQFSALRIAQLRLNELVLHRWDLMAPRQPDATASPTGVALVLDYVLGRLDPLAQRDALTNMKAVYRCVLTDGDRRTVDLVCRDGTVRALMDGQEQVDVTLHLPAEALLRLVWGRLSLATALDSGAVRPEGDREAVLALGRVFGSA